MAENKENYYSEPVQEIMGSIPSRIIRWGVTAIFSVFFLILVGCCFIRYPQTLSSHVVITSTNPLSRMAARYTGLIDTVAVTNGQTVHQGDLLARFSTPARYEDIVKVKQYLAQSMSGTEQETPWDSPLLDQPLRLGDLQLAWTEVVSIAEEYRSFRDLEMNGHRAVMIRKQIAERQESMTALKRQSVILMEDMDIQRGIFERDSILFTKDVLSKNDFEMSKQKILSRRANQAAFETSMHSSEDNLLQLSQTLAEVQLQQVADEHQYALRMADALRQLGARVDDWLDTYAIVAPIDGVVSLQDYWSRGQHANVGDIIASVVPLRQDSVEGRMKVSSVGFGKVKEGQEVKIQINGFPYMEYGILRGRVSKIAPAPEKGPDGGVYYLVETSFPNGLVSSYGIELPLIHEMDGTAQIITEDMRVIDYFLKPIKSIIHNL